MLPHDLRYALRVLSRTPGFTVAAILTLTLGIGMTTAVFSAVDAVLLRPVPFPDADRLVMIWETDRDSDTSHEPGSWPDFVDFQRQSRQIDRFAGLIASETTIAPDRGEPRRLASLHVTHELLPLVEQINALLTRLSVSLQTERRFVADAAHELRSPVAALALQVQLAERAQSEAARAAALAELKRGIARAGRLVQQLLDLARLEPGVPSEPQTPVDLAQLVREVTGEFAVRADALGVDLGAEAPASLVVQGAPSELRSLVANLVDNALRYAPSQSCVTVSLREVDDEVELAVEDAGPGSPPEQRERVLRRFQRVPGDVTSGSGLGLPIAKAIAERHRGSLRLVEARPGNERPGLSVQVRLPLAA